MTLKSIEINSYKSITEPVKVEEFSSFNILVGPNNAGKTNVLDAFEVFFNKEKESLQRKDADINLVLETSSGEKRLSYSGGEIKRAAGSSLVRINNSNSLQRIVNKELEDFKTENQEKYKEFSMILENYFQDFQISESLFRSNIKTNPDKESLSRMGEGFKRLFVMLFYIYNPRYEIILIDEPEMHLHPSVIKKFLKILSKNELGCQILMTTHHPTMVQAKFLDKTWRVSRNKNQSTAIHKFNKKYLDINIDRFVQEINDDNSAMLFADKVLLVEGVSDSILMRGLIDKFHQTAEDIKVVYAGGVGDISLYEKVCKIFNISYRIMIDGDMLDFYWKKKFGEKPASKEKKRRKLKEENIFVLKGDLEDNYPKKYQKKDTKPLNALVAGNSITKEDFSEMDELKRVINYL